MPDHSEGVTTVPSSSVTSLCDCAGARLLYRTIPKRAGLRRIVLHKSCDSDTGDIYYVLSCEYSRLLDDVVATVKTLPALRARLVGYTGIYKPMAVL